MTIHYHKDQPMQLSQPDPIFNITLFPVDVNIPLEVTMLMLCKQRQEKLQDAKIALKIVETKLENDTTCGRMYDSFQSIDTTCCVI